MPTLVQYKDWRTYLEGMDHTDRQLRFPSGHHTIQGMLADSSEQAVSSTEARERWLEANDVHTQFLDAGIGCCWFAQQGDEEPVSGETEYEAIVKLAREHGIELWAEAIGQSSAAPELTRPEPSAQMPYLWSARNRSSFPSAGMRRGLRR